jgi:hypothetical protein
MRKYVALLVLCLQLACRVFSAPPPTATQTTVRRVTTIDVVEGYTVSIPYPPYLHSIARFPEEKEELVLINDINKELFFTFVSNKNEKISLLGALDIYLSRMESRGWQIQRSESSKIYIDNVEGIILDLELSNEGGDYKGQVFSVSPRPNFVLVGAGSAYISYDNHMWESKGQATFDELIQSIRFTED